VESLEIQLRLAKKEVAITNQHLSRLLEHLEKSTRLMEIPKQIAPADGPAESAPPLVTQKSDTIQAFRSQRKRPAANPE
jgi:hypothetical protein